MEEEITCIVCGKLFKVKEEGWYNSRSEEGICQDCFDENSKVKLLDIVVGQ